ILAAEADPKEQGDEVGGGLGATEQAIAHLPGTSEHIHATFGHLSHNEGAIDPPEQAGKQLREPRIGATGAATENEIRLTLRQDRMEMCDELRRLLQIGREHGEVVPYPSLQTRGDRGEGPEITAQGNQLGGKRSRGKPL